MNKKFYFIKKETICLLLFTGLLLCSFSSFSQKPLQELIDIAKTKDSTEHTIPSWTELKRRWTGAINDPFNSAKLVLFETAINSLKDKRVPYNIVMNINGDPKTRMGFNWYNNENIIGGKLEIVKGIATNHSAFSNATPIYATTTPRTNLNYNVSDNNLWNEAGIGIPTLKSYTENKAVATGLLPGTTYSFRVGGVNDHWSNIGTFTTAKDNKDAFSFVYTTDPQSINYFQFNTAQTTTHTAFAKHQNVNFWLNCGDFVETWGGTNYAEWEWEQFFETQQDLLLKTPFAPVQGNHDVSPRNNFKSHFHTEDFPTDPQGSSTYSFSYGDALFFALNGELYNNTGYITNVKKWMQDIVENPQNQDIKWRIVYYHKSIFTGGNHQASPEVTAWRNAMATFFEDLNIDIAFQGHTHVYEVLGPIVSEVLGTKTNYTIVPGAVSNVQNVQKECSQRLNISGKIGGIFNVKEGTLYFLNSSSRGPKEPFCFNEMNCCSDIQDYPSLFTGRLGKTEKPTYSHVTVSSNTITISTYKVLGINNVRLYDEIKIVKS